MTMPSSRSRALLLIALLGPVAFFWIVSQEMTYLNWFLPAVVLLWVFSFGIWYLVYGKGTPKVRFQRFLGILLGFAGIGFVLSKLVRYEGSASGSSYPRIVWKWKTPEAERAPVETVTAPLSSTVNLAEVETDLLNFLGPDRNGIFDDLPFSTDWVKSPPQLLWRRPIGKAWSSFVVSGSQAITQQQVGDAECITSLDLATGKDLWNHAQPETRLLLERAENEGAAMGGDGPRGTPTIYEGKVYAMGATGIVNCLDLATGQSVWSRNVLEGLAGGIQRWGMATSPLILPEQNAVVVAGPESAGPTLLACDLQSGAAVWTYLGTGASYSSPRLMTLAGREQIVSINATSVSGVDPTNGKELWRHDWPGKFPKVAQPIQVGTDQLLLTASYGVGSLLIRVIPSPDGFRTEPLWKSTRLKTKFSSPAILGDYAYGLDEGRLACVDLKNGERVWKNEKFGFGQHLLFQDRLLVQTESGDVVVGKIRPEGFLEEGRINALSSMTWNTPAVAGRILLVRNDREAACYLLPPP